MSAATTTKLLTAEEYALLEDDRPSELVRGKVVLMPPPGFGHGKIFVRTSQQLQGHLDRHDVGHAVGGDSGVITQRGPDTVRGADVAFFSYRRVPKDAVPARYPDAVPELVIEIRSPSDRWRDIIAKVSEYLQSGVLMVVVLDADPRTAHVFRADEPVQVLQAGDELVFPDWLAGWRVRVEALLG